MMEWLFGRRQARPKPADHTRITQSLGEAEANHKKAVEGLDRSSTTELKSNRNDDAAYVHEVLPDGGHDKRHKRIMWGAIIILI